MGPVFTLFNESPAAELRFVFISNTTLTSKWAVPAVRAGFFFAFFFRIVIQVSFQGKAASISGAE